MAAPWCSGSNPAAFTAVAAAFSAYPISFCTRARCSSTSGTALSRTHSSYSLVAALRLVSTCRCAPPLTPLATSCLALKLYNTITVSAEPSPLSTAARCSVSSAHSSSWICSHPTHQGVSRPASRSVCDMCGGKGLRAAVPSACPSSRVSGR